MSTASRRALPEAGVQLQEAARTANVAFPSVIRPNEAGSLKNLHVHLEPHYRASASD